jgi:PPOX class probable F420-dependent enzyme
MPRLSAEDTEAFLAEPHIGVLASLRRDGRPYTVPVWHLWDGEHVWISGTESRVWCRQLMHDPRISLCVEAMAPVPAHVGIDGTAEVLRPPDFDIWPISRRLVEKYVGAAGRTARSGSGDADDSSSDAAVDAFFANMQTEPRLLIRVTPEVWRAIDMRVYRGKRADREHQARARGEVR